MKTAYDEATHTYMINGRKVPHVTGVLADLIPGWKAADWYLQRGRAVHAAAALVAQGKNFTCDERIQGQVEAVRKFFAEVRPVVVDIERPVFHSTLLYAGTLDLLCKIGGRLTVVDYKASLSPSVPYQLAAYADALMTYTYTRKGVGVELHEDGTYRMTETYDLRYYVQGWRGLLTAYRIRKELGIAGAEDAED